MNTQIFVEGLAIAFGMGIVIATFILTLIEAVKFFSSR